MGWLCKSGFVFVDGSVVWCKTLFVYKKIVTYIMFFLINFVAVHGGYIVNHSFLS